MLLYFLLGIHMLLKLLGFLSIALAFSSCGQSAKKTSIKSFVLGTTQDHAAYRPLIKQLVSNYNANVGSDVLTFSDSMDGVNSPIIITKGLEGRDGKVGWGQWNSSTERKGTSVPLPGVKPSETTSYSLQVEFDEDFLTANAKNDADGLPNYELRKLFAHEVGHGFQMDHDPDVTQVMYMDVSGQKNFAAYWPKVRSFFAN
jgi:hypothetical protein